MASRRRNTICVLFDKKPKGTHFKKGGYSWVNAPEALDYISKGYGKEYDPDKKVEKKPPRKKATKETIQPDKKDDKK